MKFKRFLSLVLAAGMLTGAAVGCGGATEDGSKVTPDQEVDENVQSGPDDNQQQVEEDGEITEITVALRTLSPVEEAGYTAVQKAVNEITEREIHVKVNLMWVDSGT